jgi:hypothetical protein
MSTEPRISLSITAAPVEDARSVKELQGHYQLRMGALSFIYFTPEVARQWISVLETIAAKETE